MIIKETSVKTVITKSDLPVCDFSVNPYVGCTHACKYCCASFMKRFDGHTETRGEFLDVKKWSDIKNSGKYCGKEFFIGFVTDPYNPPEAKYKRTRAFLKQMQGSGAKISIQTKSDLVLRDLDLIKTFSDARVGFSINTLDEKFRKDMDNASSIESRLAAMKAFYDAGVRTTCFISPIFPGITDVEAIIESVKDNCNLIWLENLNLRGSYKMVIIDYIRDKYSTLFPLYNEIYFGGNKMYWEMLDVRLREYAKKNALDYVRSDDTMKRPFDALPTIVNFFYHEEIKKSARKKYIEPKRC